jgi:hypothetical protein
LSIPDAIIPRVGVKLVSLLNVCHPAKSQPNARSAAPCKADPLPSPAARSKSPQRAL